MTVQSRIMFCAVVLTLGCSSGQDSGGDDDCFSGDIDGIGTDTGNIPQLYGNWTTTFGTRSFHAQLQIWAAEQHAQAAAEAGPLPRPRVPLSDRCVPADVRRKIMPVVLWKKLITRCC